MARAKTCDKGSLMALKIYGVPRSRASRVLWMAKELGLDYEHVKVDFATGETRTPAHLALNPNGHVPVIDDDGLILWESMAINLYLAKKYGADTLYPSRLEDEARAWQWSFWAVTEVERPVLTAMMNRAIYPESQRDLAARPHRHVRLPKGCRVAQELRRAPRRQRHPPTPAGVRFEAMPRCGPVCSAMGKRRRCPLS
jgi:glutathione S-transferase